MSHSFWWDQGNQVAQPLMRANQQGERIPLNATPLVIGVASIWIEARFPCFIPSSTGIEEENADVVRGSMKFPHEMTE